MRRLLTSTLLLSINADIRTREKRIMRTKMIAAGGNEYRLLVRRAETKTIYTVLLARTDQPPQVLAVGDIDRVPLSKEVKDNSKGDPFVVVVRSGNYLRH